MKGRAIIKALLRENYLSAADFFGPGHVQCVVAVRAEAIKRMHALGMNKCAIARVMRRNHSTISYWLRPDWRKRRKEYYRRYWVEGESVLRDGKAKVKRDRRNELVGFYLAGQFDEVRRLQSSYGVHAGYTRDVVGRMRREAAEENTRRSATASASQERLRRTYFAPALHGAAA